ncbi:hypothetical protein SprV_0501832700 [Sparganum proliferum]
MQASWKRGDAALDAVVAEAAGELEGAMVSADREEVAVVTFKEDEGTSMNAAVGETLVAEEEIFAAEVEILAAKEGIFVAEEGIFAAEEGSFAVAVVAEVRKLARAVEDFAVLKEEAAISSGGATAVEEAEDEASDRPHQKLRNPVFSRQANLHHGQRVRLLHPR